MKACDDALCPYFGCDKELPYLKQNGTDVLIVGDYPTKFDLLNKRPFTGVSLELLESAFAEAGLDFSNTFLAYSSRCRLDKSTLSAKQFNEVLNCCRKKLERLVRIIKPKAILTCGELPLKQLMKLPGGVRKNRGTFSNVFGCHSFITYSPLYCNLNKSYISEFKNDIKTFARFVNNGYVPLNTEVNVIQTDDLESILPDDLKAIAIDTETQGLDWLDPNALLLSFSICFDEHTAYQIPVNEWSTDINDHDFFIDVAVKGYRHVVEKTIPIKRNRNYFKNLKILAAILKSGSVRKYMFNGQFDLCFINQEHKKAFGTGIELSNFAIDVQALAHLLDENVFSRPSLEAVRKSYTTFDNNYSINFDAQIDKSNMVLVDSHEMGYYAALDAYTTFVSAKAAKVKLIELGKSSVQNYFIKFVMPTLTYALPTLTMNGGYIDKQAIPTVKHELAVRIKTIQEHIIKDLIPYKIKKLHEEKGLKLSRNALIRDALYHKDGYAIKIKETTKGGSSPSMNAQTRVYLKSGNILPKAKELIESYETWSELNVLLTRYIKGFETSVRADGRIHPTYAIVTTSTGRTCLAKGTLVYVLDSREKVPIEDIKVGDWVWTFDESSLKPIPTQVAWSGLTHRDKSVITVAYQTQGNRSVKSINCTPEHLFLLRDGSYKQAKDLTYGDRLVSLERSVNIDGYRHMYFTGNSKDTREHCYIWQRLNAVSLDKRHIHHKDENVSNNNPDNLECLSTKEHMAKHPQSAERREKSKCLFNSLRAKGLIPKPPKGMENKNYKQLDKDYCISTLLKYKGKIKVMCDHEHLDLATAKRECRRHGIDWLQYKEMFDGNGDLITEERINEAKCCAKVHDAARLLHVNFYKAKRLLSDDNNHMVVSVTDCGHISDVYDLTIDGQPNFIANGVCVHNSTSSPSFQNLPKHSSTSKVIRRLIIPDSGNVLLSLDYSQNEIRWLAQLSGDETLRCVYRDDQDVHTNTALALLNKTIDEVSEEELKTTRRYSKNLNFGLLYGMSIAGFQRYCKVKSSLDLTYDEAEKFINIFFSTYPGIKRYHKRTINFARKFKYVQSPFGRMRRLPGIASSDSKEVDRCERQALNHAIQSAASDTALISLNQLLSKGLLRPKEAKPIIFIHDELVFEVREDMVEHYYTVIKHEMENPPLKEFFNIDMAVPLKVEAKIGHNFADLVAYPAKNEEKEA